MRRAYLIRDRAQLRHYLVRTTGPLPKERAMKTWRGNVMNLGDRIVRAAVRLSAASLDRRRACSRRCARPGRAGAHDAHVMLLLAACVATALPLTVAPLAAQRLLPPELPALRWGGESGFIEIGPLPEVRYNRVEGLSFPITATGAFGMFLPSLDIRVATAGRVLRPQFRLEFDDAEGRLGALGFAAYERVATVEHRARPFGAENSIVTFLFGRDEGDYYAQRGFELVRRSDPERRTGLTLRLYGEQQDTVVRRRPFTLAGTLGGQRWIGPTERPEEARQFGAMAGYVAGAAEDAERQWQVAPWAEAAAGDFGYARAALIAAAATPLPRGFSAGVEVGGGVAGGNLPGQALWHIGGTGSVRGYSMASAVGTSFWRARAELGRAVPDLPDLRAVVFTDAGRAYGRGSQPGEPTLTAFGVGAVAFDGLVRVDLARSVRFLPGWRLHFTIDDTLWSPPASEAPATPR
jgi:hypothetical protein